ncbi:MAG: caspase family protein [Acidobacteria bacterium]|nr:caspase family protein [Acidobacteriota bacterium]
MIGINDYRSSLIPDLRGAINDIEFISQMLSTKYGFLDKNIRKIIDKDATRQGILSALDKLEKESGPEDVIYLHYSGHGSQVEDLNNDESDHLDETIVPHDGRTDDIADITDDELGTILTRFQSPNIIVLLDSCHAGTATRSIALSTRSIPKDTRLDLYRKMSAGTRAVVPLIAERHLLMSGAAANQRALDGPIEGRSHGFFSYAFGKTLSAAPPQTPVKEILRGVESELERIRAQFGNLDMPEPQLEAQESRFDKSLFPVLQEQSDVSGSDDGARLPWLLAEPAGEGKALLKNALSLDARENSTWLIYPPGEKEFAGSSAIAVARVIELKDADALADRQPENSRISPNSRAIVLTPAFPSISLPVRFISDSSEISNAVQVSLQKLIAPLKVVGSEEFARFIIIFEEKSCKVFGSEGLAPIDQFELADAVDAAHRLTRILARSITASELLALVNPSSKIKVDLKVAGQTDRKTEKLKSQRGVQVTSNLETPRFHVRKEEEPRSNRNSLQLKVLVSQDAYITIVDVDQEGGVNLLFPNEHQKEDFYPQGFVPKDEQFMIPDSLESGNKAGFNWDISPPGGIDTIRVFASSDLETAEAIRKHVKDLASQSSSSSSEAARFVSFSKLHRDLSTRGIRLVRNLPENQKAKPNPDTAKGDWNAASITVLVQN